MNIENKSLREAYAQLEKATPLGRRNCGELCGAVCCTSNTGDSMELFPFEKELFESAEGFEIMEGEVALVKCNGGCNRDERPLACRIYPLFPMVIEENGEDKILVIYDPRAKSSCPLCAERVKLDRRFVRAVRRAGKYLLKDPATASHLKNTSDYLRELIELEILLKG